MRWTITLALVALILVTGCAPPLTTTPGAPGTTGVSPTPTGPFPPPLTSPPSEPPSWSPANDPNFHDLTDTEQAEVVRIALASPTISQWLNGRTDYQAGPLEWYAIKWNNSEPGRWWALPYSVVRDGVPGFVPQTVRFYPGLTIRVEALRTQAQIAVDLQEQRAVLVDGPYPMRDLPP